MAEGQEQIDEDKLAAEWAAMADAGGSTVTSADGTLIVSGLVAAQVGDIAFEHGVRLHELTVVRASLEAAFMELTADSVEYRGGEGQGAQGIPGPGPAQEQLAGHDQLSGEGRA